MRLLWVDDDGPERFRYEETVLREDYQIEVGWAASVTDALTCLRTEAYDAIVLDQMLPFSSHSTVSDYWGGCVILHWLKRASYPSTAPPAEDPQVLKGLPPLATNAAAPVCFVSAFNDEAVHRELLRACEQLPIFAKPLDLEVLERFIDAALAGQPFEAE